MDAKRKLAKLESEKQFRLKEERDDFPALRRLLRSLTPNTTQTPKK